MATTAEIVARAQAGWPYDAVPYSQSGVFNDDDGAGPHIGGYRRDCSGLATMAGGGPAPGYSTVTMLTSGWVRPIPWAELAAGDFVGALGPGTAGDAGHVMVVESVNRAANTYTVLEQAGYGPGPDRNTYTIGDGQGRNYLPYRLSTLEVDMLSPCKQGDSGYGVWVLQSCLFLLGFGGPTDQHYGPETSKALAACCDFVGIHGGVQDGSVFGPSEYAAVHAAFGKRFGGGTPAAVDPVAVGAAVKAAVGKIHATTTLSVAG